jgi:hypothetical protein
MRLNTAYTSKLCVLRLTQRVPWAAGGGGVLFDAEVDMIVSRVHSMTELLSKCVTTVPGVIYQAVAIWLICCF